MNLWLRDDKTAQAAELLNRYSFELEGYAAESLVVAWGHHFTAEWIRLAVIEALYQGRYKAVSVEQILAFWQRRGQPLCHFSHEFERIICDRLTTSVPPVAAQPSLPTADPTAVAVVVADDRERGNAATVTDLVVEPEGASLESLELVEAAMLQDAHATVTELPSLPATLAAIVAAGQAGASQAGSPAVSQAGSQPVASETLATGGFRPGAYLDASNNHQANWERLDASKHPIHEFVPPAEPSEFYVRLKSVAHQDGDGTVAPESVAESG